MSTANGIGVFGVFDGHAGRQCSQFVAQEFPEMVARCNTAQLSPQVLEHICLELDENWIITQNDDSGSTAAFVVAVPRPQVWVPVCLIVLRPRSGSLMKTASLQRKLHRTTKNWGGALAQ